MGNNFWYSQQCKMKLFRKEGFHSILGQPTFDPLVIEDGSGKPTSLDFWWLFFEGAWCGGHGRINGWWNVRIVRPKDEAQIFEQQLAGVGFLETWLAILWHIIFHQRCNSKTWGSPGGDNLLEGFAAWLQRRGYFCYMLSIQVTFLGCKIHSNAAQLLEISPFWFVENFWIPNLPANPITLWHWPRTSQEPLKGLLHAAGVRDAQYEGDFRRGPPKWDTSTHHFWGIFSFKHPTIPKHTNSCFSCRNWSQLFGLSKAHFSCWN